MPLANEAHEFLKDCLESQEVTDSSNTTRRNLSELQQDVLTELTQRIDPEWVRTDDFKQFYEFLDSLIQDSQSLELIDETDEVTLAKKFLALLAIANTVLVATLTQTATQHCDTEKLNFVDFFTSLTSFTNSDRCKNHLLLLPFAIKWLEACGKYLSEHRVFSNHPRYESPTDTIRKILDATCCLMAYVNDILVILDFFSLISTSDAQDMDTQIDYHNSNQFDWVDEGPCLNVGEDDDESLIDDSDDESTCNKLCTFTLTQKDFANQHWYHCHTCNMIDRVGVCTVCAKVCHKDHDISYAKYGAFFCDCAGRENSTCMALVKRAPAPTNNNLDRDQIVSRDHSHRDQRSDLAETGGTGSIRDASDIKKNSATHQTIAKQLEPYKSELMAILSRSNISTSSLALLTHLITGYVQSAQNESQIGRSKRALSALNELHSEEKVVQMTESLMLPTLGSQEGAFENVRVNYSGEHASMIKQLLSKNTLRRIAMTSLSSPLGKRQHLVVCHERGKITLLQLNTLLRQADSSKRKLTLTRLASAPIPFSVISIAANPFNEDVLAVCGLKDCHILTFTQTGLVSSHIKLNLSLSSASDYIIKVVWVAGSQTELAILTSEVVKIFDLSEDSVVPKHHLKSAFGQLKDITFITPEHEKTRYIIMMTASGQMLIQALNANSSSNQEAFYVTTELQLQHSSISEKDGRINGGGVSLYFSHAFKTLFLSYANGNFMASMPSPTNVMKVFPLELELLDQALPASTTSATYASVAAGVQDENGSQEELSEPTSKIESPPTSSAQPLCQWSEVPGHVGMIMAFCQNSNNPVIIMLKPDTILVQEIRYLSIKSRITDATAIRHTTSTGEVRTTLILLCEDGSLRIYMASQELTDYWLKLSPVLNLTSDLATPSFMIKSLKRKKMMSKATRRPNNIPQNSDFPVDFFENLQQINDIEFGGNDPLSVYSVQQLKNRLNTSGMHIACAKASGFSVDVINNDPNMVICGVRCQVGSHDLAKAPTSIEIAGRTVPINPATPRWYDLPLTREESLQASKRLTIVFGPSPDQNNIVIVDSIKIYGKTKENFSWPDETDDQVSTTNLSGEELVRLFIGQEFGGHYQKLMIYSMENLGCCLNLNLCQDISREEFERLGKELSISLLTIPYSPQVLRTVKCLLLVICSSRQSYNQLRDMSALDFVAKSLASLKSDKIDCELFSRVVFIMKSLAYSKPSNLNKLSDCLSTILIERNPSLKCQLSTDSAKLSQLIKHLHELFMLSYLGRPANSSLASVASTSFMNHDDTLQPLIELIHLATLHDHTILPEATNVIIDFLLSEDLNISLCARYTFIRLLRAKSPHSAVTCDKNQKAAKEIETIPKTEPSQVRATDPPTASVAEQDENIVEPNEDHAQNVVNSQQSSIASQLRNVLRDHMEGSRYDNEDDIAIAIALSLQDDSQNNSVTDNAITAAPTTSGRSELNPLSDRMPSAEELMSDTTASGVASDDEVSTSGVKSTSIVRPSMNQRIEFGSSSSGPGLNNAAFVQENFLPDSDGNKTSLSTSSKVIELERFRQQRFLLLEELIKHLPDSREAGGLRSISLLHALLVLTLDLDCENKEDQAILQNLLRALRQELLWNTDEPDKITVRSPTNEVKLVIMRMFSILMSKVRTSSVASAISSSTKAETNCGWSTLCSSITASSLIVESDVMNFCYRVLVQLLDDWKEAPEKNPVFGGLIQNLPAGEPLLPVNRKTLPRSSAQSNLPDYSPFFLRQCVRGQSADLFEEYLQLITEMVLRIPYQIKKVSGSSSNNLDPVEFSSEWSTILCEYLMIPIPSFIKKHVRKLLTFICGSKEKYRQLRDFHFLESHMKSVKSMCGLREDFANQEQFSDFKALAVSYEAMTFLVEHLKSCTEIAQNRCSNWQIYCFQKDTSLLPFLMSISLNFGDDVTPIILELIQHALTSAQSTPDQTVPSLLEGQVIATTVNDPMANQTMRNAVSFDSLSAHLAQQLSSCIPKDHMCRFVQSFLLETNSTSIRWQAHSLIYNLWINFLPLQQHDLLLALWSLWGNLPKYGRKASQFVDLLGYMTLKCPPSSSDHEQMFCQEALSVLKQQNQLLINHPNAHIYGSIQGLVDLESYYLESEPCSVCNSPEVAYSNIKLGSIKVDSRFTTTTQIIKLIGSHTILKFSLRISDIKRSKMVKVISIYYNNRTVHSVVELKNKTGIWSLARRYPLAPGQADIKIEFTLPIVACNLMIEFSEFYENLQASSETLQCPRCSTSVSANPGVCSNCGENVFQCHKCRAINYDEKDPFLCISCGFCKYARFDISLTAKPTCAVDPIENEEGRNKTVSSISNLLEKADRVYKNLMHSKPTLELLLMRIHEQAAPDRHFDETILNIDQVSQQPGPNSSNPIPAQSIVVGYAPTAASSGVNSSVNKAIQQLAQKYCVECKNLFEELSKITHKVLASRRELVEYDNRQLRRCLNAGSSILSSADRRKSKVYSSLSSGSGRCYGCSMAAVEHCITMLKAMSTISKLRTQICENGVINELVNFNLRSGTYAMGQEIRQLLCSLTRDDINATTTLTNLLLNKIEAISKQEYQPFEISHIVRHDIALLSITLDSDDNCWEQRLRCLIKIFAFAFEIRNPMVMECLIIPCLRLILSIVRPPTPTTRRYKDKSLESIASVRTDNYRSRVSLENWIKDTNFLFDDWRKRAARPANLNKTTKQLKPISSILRRQTKAQYRSNFLVEKYGNRWRLHCSRLSMQPCQPVAALPNGWLKRLLFNRSSKTVRLMTKSLVEALFSVPSRRKEIVDLLTTYLDEIGPAGECAQEFYGLYKSIMLTDHWRYYLALKGILLKLANLITVEIDHLQELEETTLNSSLSLGYSLKMLQELMTTFVTVPTIRTHYKSKLVGFVLKGYLSLRRLVVQRTKVIDETQEMLLDLLEGMTTGSEPETAAFIQICVDAIKDCAESDIRTPVFIFERLCSTIHPEENANCEFFVSLEKDPQQEDYLQGRMLGNPYSSNEPGLGPLMKDIKNKICQDCELLALLEDDSSMELLVANKIICLDLPVRDVYKRIWCPENHESDAMRIVYRMRGLLGDATEEFIDSLDSRSGEEVDEEQVFKMANLVGPSGGFEVILDSLKRIDDISSPFKPLLDVILKLFNHCTRTRNNRLKLMSLEYKAIEIFLNTLRLALEEREFLELAGLPNGLCSPESSKQTTAITSMKSTSSAPSAHSNVVVQILSIMETLLSEASKQPREVFNNFSVKACGSILDVKFLLDAAQALSHRLPQVAQKILQVLPFLTLGDKDKMLALVDHFESSIDFDKFDEGHSTQAETTIDLFCIMVDAIERNENGNQLKDFIVSEGIVARSTEYLIKNAPPLKSSLLAASEEWREFTSRPSLKYVLRLLGGLSQTHVQTQVLISRECVPIIHGLEQVSSDSHVGTLAENLLESIKQHPAVAEKIALVRKQTKEEKKRLAMAVRERQLGALGMKANERGQVTAKSKLLEQCLDLVEDSGLICIICREGYKIQPTKVLGIYTYTKRCILDEFEMKPKKSYGYTTVTHFNTVHVDCHMSAVRSARSRDEWDSAALQNANTRCNGLLPIWGPQVPESAYANALARHNTYLQDSTGHRDIGYHSTVHDIRLQLLRFAQERSFSEDTGGGGPQSNLHLLPYMIQTAAYVLNTTKSAGRECKRVLDYFKMSSSEVLENCYEADSPYYWCSLALLVVAPTMWKKKRIHFLQRLIICNHVRRVGIKPPASLSDTRLRAYAYYKSALIFFAMVDSFYKIVFNSATSDDEWNQDWSSDLASYLKNNDQVVNDNIEVLLNFYQNSLLPCTSLERFFEVVGLDEISQPSDFILNTLKSA